MAHVRIPFGKLSNNPRGQKQLTLWERGYIIGRHSLDASPASVAAYYSMPRQTIESTITTSQYRIQGHNLPKSGRPKVYTHRDYRKLLRHVRLHPKDTYEQVRTATGCTFKNDTIRKYLALYGIAN
jgi:hypothetical protein